MRHIILDTNDVPPPMPLYDRRRTPDRRRVWRGGRRDSDWLHRPLNGFARLKREQTRLSGWRRALSTIHLLW
jgi:hypothetical protein